MHLRYRVELEESERQQLETLVAGGTRAVRRVKRAQILLAAAAGVSDAEIATTLQVGTSTVYRTKQHFVEHGLDRALAEDPRPGGKRKLAATDEALLVATACAQPPAGRACWTLALLASEVIRLTAHTSISRATIGRRLAENDLKPWQEKMWCVPHIDAPYVARMEDVLGLYTTAPRPGTAVVCVDETPQQLIGEVRSALPPVPGHPARHDYEYRRNGTANVFVAVDAHQPQRYTKVTARRTAVDFAEWLRDLIDVHYAGTARILLVLDNLSTHTSAALYEAFPPAEARRLCGRLEFHLCAEARELAEHGGDRDRRLVRAMPRSTDPRSPHAHVRSRRVDPRPQRRRGPDTLDVWHRAGARQTRACLPGDRPHGGRRVNQSKSLR